MGGHDTTFANAADIPYSTKPYVSCGTWTTVSVETSLRRDGFIDDGQTRYILAPNGALLKQLCFKSGISEAEATAEIVIGFLSDNFKGATAAEVAVFGAWSSDLVTALHRVNAVGLRFTPIKQHAFWGCVYLPRQSARYIQKTGINFQASPYYCQGA